MADTDDEADTAGVGFESKYAAEEQRGREALEKMRESVGARGYDSTLQGLTDEKKAPEPTAEEMQRVACEMNAPATGFIQACDSASVDVRFFSTKTEYGMCGHGTLGLMTWLVERSVFPLGARPGSTLRVTLRTPSSAPASRRRRSRMSSSAAACPRARLG